MGKVWVRCGVRREDGGRDTWVGKIGKSVHRIERNKHSTAQHRARVDTMQTGVEKWYTGYEGYEGYTGSVGRIVVREVGRGPVPPVYM